MNNAQLKLTRQEITLIATLGLLQFAHIVDFMILMPLGPQLMSAFNIGPGEFGLLVSSYTFAAALAGIAGAFLVDRFDRKHTLHFFAMGFTFGTAFCGLAWSYEVLLLARFLTGAFGGVISSLVILIVADQVPYERRGSAMGLVMMAFSLASVFGVPLAIFVANRFNWHAPFLGLAVMALLVSVFQFFSIPSMRQHFGKTKLSPADTLAAIATPDQLLALTFMFCLIFGQFLIIPFVSPSLVSNVGLTNEQLPLIYIVGGLCSMITQPLVGRWSDRVGKKKIFMIATVFSLIPMIVLTRLSQISLPAVLAVVAAFFMLSSGRMVPAQALISQVPDPERRGSFMSFSSSMQQLAMSLSAFVAGHIVTRSSTGVLQHYEIVGMIAAACTIIPLFLVGKITLNSRG